MKIIPAAKSVKKLDGYFIFNKDTKFNCEYDNIRNSFNDFTLKTIGFILSDGKDISVFIDKSLKCSEEGYNLTIDNGIVISAISERGLFYGVQTLKQIIAQYCIDGESQCKIPKVLIDDEPRFAYRGFMFDCARHYFDVETLKKYIEAIALLKMNVFHWHLTEDQGWRIEVSSYPKLTEIGSKRRETKNDGKPYGGFYTIEQVKEIIKFATERYIEVIPEFDMPGHTRAAIAAYPELSCSGKPVEVSTKFGIHSEILCGGNDKSYQFIDAVLNEFNEIFPSGYVHLGGDEAVKHEWYKCDKCQSKINELGLKNEEELQAYMTNYAVNNLKSNGKVAICWNESANSGILDKSVILQFWNDGKEKSNVINEIKNGRKIIVSQFTPYYLDYPYAMHSLKAVYRYEPIFDSIKDYAANVFGVEAPIWTEWVNNTDVLAFRVFPRLTAVAESAWTPVENKNYDSFIDALPAFDFLLEKITGIKSTSLKECNPNKIKSVWIMMKFGIDMFDFETARRSAKADKEMRKMRALRQGDKK